MKRSILNPILLAAMVAWLFVPAWRDGRTLWVRDNLVNFLPNHVYWVERVKNGEIPHWNPYVAGGMPYAADPIQGTFYPPRLLALFFDNPVLSFNLLMAFHLFLLGWGFERLLRKVGTGAIASLTGGMIVMLSGTFLNSTFLVEFLYAQAWTGWLLCAALDWSRGERAGLRLSLYGGLMLLAGEPQTFVVNWGVLLIFWLVGPARNEEGAFDRLKRSVKGCFAFGVAAIGIALIQWIPAWYLIRETGRGVEGFTLQQAQGCGFHPVRWIEMVIPGLFGDDAGDLTIWSPKVVCPGHSSLYISTTYIGMTAGLFAVLGAFNRKSRELSRAMLVVVLLAGVLAAGKWSPLNLYQWLYEYLPGWNRFRNSERLLPWVTMSLGVLAALGLEQLRQEEGRNILARLILCLVAFLAVVTAIPWPDLFHRFDPGMFPYAAEVIGRAVDRAVPGALAASVILGLIFIFRIKALLLFLPLVIFADLVRHAPEMLEFWPVRGFPQQKSPVLSRIEEKSREDQFPYPPRYTVPVLRLAPVTPTSIVDLRMATQTRWLIGDPDLNTYYRLASPETMNSFVTDRAATVRKSLSWEAFNRLWGTSGLILAEGMTVDSHRYELLETMGPVRLAWSRSDRSRVICPEVWVRLADDGSVPRFWKQHAQGGDADFDRTVWGPFPDEGKSSISPLCRTVFWNPEHYELDVSQGGNSPVVLRESLSVGWSAVLVETGKEPAGKSLDIFPANHAQMAVFPGPGHHRIRFTYFTPGLGMGLVGTAISLLVALWMGKRFWYPTAPATDNLSAEGKARNA